MPIQEVLYLHIIYMQFWVKIQQALAWEPCFYLNKMSPLYSTCKACVYISKLLVVRLYHRITVQFLTKIMLRFQRKKNRLKQENIHMIILKNNSEELQSYISKLQPRGLLRYLCLRLIGSRNTNANIIQTLEQSNHSVLYLLDNFRDYLYCF